VLSRKSFLLAALAATLAFVYAPRVAAQATFGSIIGVITDPSGATVPNASVTVTDQNTGLEKTAVSNSRGEYEVTHLNFGTYTVKVAAAGFVPFEHRDLVLESQQTARVDVPLEVSSPQSTVTVTAGSPVIETDSPTISSVKSARQLRDLPLNTLNTVLLNDFLFFTPTGYQSVGSKFDMGGARATQLYYNIDGISANSPAFGVQNSSVEPSVESIAEMKFNTVDNKAEYSLVTNVTAVTKSGQNTIHGRLFEQNTNTALNARSFFASSVGQNIINDFGASVGGPIRRNKAFYFGTYEGFRQRIPAALAPSLPTALMRSGNFSELLAGSRPTVITNPYTGQPFPGNIIPGSMLDSAAIKWQQQFFPSPNFGPPNLTVANFRGTYPQQTTQDKIDARVDYYFSPRHTVYGRYSYTRLHPHAIDSGVPPENAGYRVNTRTGHLAAISDTWTISPNLVNEFKVGYTRGSNPREGELSGQAIIDALGIHGVPPQPMSIHNIPTVSISNFQTIVQVAGEVPTENTFQALDQVTWIRGSHTLKTGAEFRPQQSNDYVYPSFGSYTFTNRFTGYSYSDFLLGLPQNTSLTYQRPSTATRYWYLSMFIQDDWKVSSKLTLSYGLRYEYDKPPVDAFDVVSTFDPHTGSIVVPNQKVLQQQVNPLFPPQIPIITADQAGYPQRPLRTASKLDFQPRFGFAYRPFDDKTVIRGGYGIYYDALGGDLFSLLSGGPFGLTESFTNTFAAGQPALTFQNPFLGTGATGAVNMNATTLHVLDPRVQQMNFTVERTIASNTGIRLSYIHTLSTRLLYAININQPPASTTPFTQSRRPYPLFNNILLYQNGGTQSYNAFSTELNHRYNRGLEFNAAWTWAKNLTDADEFGRTQGGPTIENSYNRVRQRGDAQYSPRHRIYGTTIWELPFGKSRRWLNNGGVSDWILGGWQLSATYAWQTGSYLTPTFSGSDPSNTNTIGGIPDRISDGNLPADQRSIVHWFDGSAFVAPPNGRFGNAGTGILIGPSRQTGNLGAFKTFRPIERMSVRVQATFTNVLNHPNFNDPNLNISAPASVGTITSVQTRDFGGPRSGLLAIFVTF
jgi:hypothetical protein